MLWMKLLHSAQTKGGIVFLLEDLVQFSVMRINVIKSFRLG